MKKIILLLVLISGLSFAQGNSNGLGIWFADYGWGLDYKHLNNKTAWDIYLGSNVDIDAGFYFLYNDVIKVDASSVGRIPLYWGPNIGFGWWDNSWTDNGLRYENSGFAINPNLVGGISWFLPTSLKMDLSAEIYIFPIKITSQSNGVGGQKSSSTKIEKRGGGDFMHLRILFHMFLF